jgi:hypothetical protein
MKKQVLALVLVGVMAALAPAFAKNDEGHDRGVNWHKFFHFEDKHNDQFAVAGVIKSVGSGTVVITATSHSNVPNVTNNEITVKTDANTKVYTSSDKKNTTLTLANLAVGQKVTVTGTVSGTDALAKAVVVINSGVVVGKVTAKTGNSITITNGVTSEVKTITTDADTKIKIDGETKTIADVQVGDSGWVKFKTVGTNLVAKIAHLFR